MRPAQTQPFSWQSDPAVPGFDDSRTLLVMDGHCALCSAAARRIARWDTHDRVRIARAASPLGSALLRHFQMDPEDPDTWLMLDRGAAYGSLDAMTRLFPAQHPVFAPLNLLQRLPLPVQDWLYARIARNRYTLFGRSDLCALPDDRLRQRLLQ